MVKKSRRKELRQPDEFVTLTMRVAQWARDHQRLVTLVTAVIVVAVVAVTLTMHLISTSRVRSSAALWPAVEAATAPVVDARQAEELPRGIKYFDSNLSRAKAASEGFEKVLKEYNDTGAGRAARLGLASEKLGAGDYAAAQQLYQEFLTQEKDLDEFQGLALEGLGYALEGQKNYDGALAKFRELEKASESDFQDLARYHQARMLEKLNKRDEAANLYRGVVRRAEQASDDMVTNLFIRDRAEVRLALIDPGADVLKTRSKARSAELLRQMLGGAGGAPPPPRPAPPSEGADQNE